MLTLLLAFVADLFIGDPVYPFHPVRLMGRAIEWGEDFFRRLIPNEKVGGAVLALSLPALIFFLMQGILLALGKIHFILFWAANVLGIYFSVSIHDLNKEGIRIYRDLKERNLPQARLNVARIVGRDTQDLSEEEVVRAAVEAIAENTVDGIVAPLFYAALGGAPLALAYKAVNTLDSMIGYKNDRYRDFGFFAAKQDEVVNWFPALLAYGAIAMAALGLRKRFKKALQVGWRDGVAAFRGISAIAEATFAGSMGLRFGGRSHYQNQIIDVPYMGIAERSFQMEAIPESLRLMFVSSWITLILCLTIRAVIG